MDKYQKELLNIKKYLERQGVEVDTVIMWQSGFSHEGTKLDLPIRVTAQKDCTNCELIQCVPRCALLNEDTPRVLFIKRYDSEIIG